MKFSARYHVVTVGLSPDLKRVHPAFGRINRGDVSRQQLLTVLEVYRQLETDCSPADSHFLIEADSGRFVVRAAARQLTLLEQDASPPVPAVPVTAEQIIARLGRAQEISVTPKRPPTEPVWRSLATLVLICAGIGLVLHALKPVFVPERADPPAEITLVTDPAEVKTRQDAITGIFATGQRPGDRHLTVSAQGHVVFAELGPRQSLGSGADSFRIGRRDKQTCIVTTRSGVIEALNANTLVYSGDTYRRVN